MSEIPGITIERAAEIINKSPHSVRQLAYRGKLDVQRVGRNIYLDIDSVLTYQARKKGLPSWEENIDSVKGRSFVSLEFASNALRVQQSYIVKLLKKEIIEGYVTASGEIMIPKDSVNAYLRRPDVDTKDL